MATGVTDFTDTELSIVTSAVRERYGQAVPVEVADTELRMYPEDRELTTCPCLYWKARDCSFVIAKTADSRYRSMFFYRVHQMFGTGREEYDDLGDCVLVLLRVQADHEKDQAGVSSGKTGQDIS
jgi:hypothetical protein